MSKLLFELPLDSAARSPQSPCLTHKSATLDYAAVAAGIDSFAAGLIALGLKKLDRVAVYLPKQFETVLTMYGAARAGCVFVPVNPLLKPLQVTYILRDCNVRVLVTSADRLATLTESLSECPDLAHVVVVAADTIDAPSSRYAVHRWSAVQDAPRGAYHRVIDQDMVSIFYTSGSTGKPKGVVLSHKNMVTGAHSVAQYLGNVPADRLLAVLPFGFDYGFSQTSTAFHVGASVVLMDYLFARDILTLLDKERVTGLAGVPPLWSQLAELQWPPQTTERLRYITNSGGTMPAATLRKLRDALPKTQVFLMYGLTEAFRSTYLPPAEIDRRPGSVGKAIPNAEILVVRPDGTPCGPDEPGELVHRGSLVALGYWNDAAKTAERFKPAPAQPQGLKIPEIAVWSGDTVRTDADGYLYFIGRGDEMIKTSGYRVSPSEVEEAAYASGLVADAVAVGIPDPVLGHMIALIVAPAAGQMQDTEALLKACRNLLPTFMVPGHISWRDSLPRNPNGKYDRATLGTELRRALAQPETAPACK
jgi:acyl-CoA ligase (AMP-forming) (exosortase A-associated)